MDINTTTRTKQQLPANISTMTKPSNTTQTNQDQINERNKN